MGQTVVFWITHQYIFESFPNSASKNLINFYLLWNHWKAIACLMNSGGIEVN